MSKVKANKLVKTRFAPSPTGMLHIGGARTALFSKLYARHMGGEFLVRIEDTDQNRNSEEAVKAITEGMDWLGLSPDSEYIYQSNQLEEHKKAVQKLLDNGNAYECYYSTKALDKLRTQAQKDKEKFTFRESKYPSTEEIKAEAIAEERKPVIRLKSHEDGFTIWKDAVQGTIKYPNKELDDLIIARGDGTPTYNLAVTVDDANMGITHVIRGDDHINNTPKQIQIYEALGLEIPTFAHIPLIHGDDGKKLSKRHGAVSTLNFKEQGYLPEAVCNYLLRLGWSHGDDEVINNQEAEKLFDICNINKGASTFNTKKLDWLNGQYLKNTQSSDLILLLKPFLEKTGVEVTEQGMDWIEKSLPELSQRAKRLTDLAESAVFYLKQVPLVMDKKATEALKADGAKYLKEATSLFEKEDNWNQDTLHDYIHHYCEDNGYKFGQVAQPLRAALTGTTVSPSVFHIMEVLGKDESMKRLQSAIQ